MITSFSLLSLIIAIPFLGCLFALLSQENEEKNGKNVYNVTIFTIISNIVLLFRTFMVMNVNDRSFQLVEKFNWLENPNINILFGIDIFSGLLLLAVHLAILIGIISNRNQIVKSKSLCVFTLVFLGLFSGLLIASDIFSFYLFFEALLIPAYMLTGMYGEIKKDNVVYRFFIYNFFGALFLFAGTMLLFVIQQGDTSLVKLNKIIIRSPIEYIIWGSFFVAFLSRIPIWPFHSYQAAVSSGVKSPLLFIINNLLPLTGVYGFIRFLPKNYSSSISYFIIALEIIAIITMIFISLIGFINKEPRYKLFSYISVCYLIYLLSSFSKSPLMIYNVAFSFFSFILIISAMSALLWKINRQTELVGISSDGFLYNTPRMRFAYGFLTFSAIGFPLSSLFLNNFFIISRIFANNIYIGILVIFSLLLVFSSIWSDYFRLCSNTQDKNNNFEDIKGLPWILTILILIFLLMSFIRPLWLLEF